MTGPGRLPAGRPSRRVPFRLRRSLKRVARRGAQAAAALVPGLPLPRRLSALFDYYAAHHLRIALAARPLETEDGALAGYLEEVSVSRDRLTVTGWTLGPAVSLRVGKIAQRVPVSVDRPDVAAAMGCRPRRGFRARLPVAEGVLDVALEGTESPLRVRIDLPDARRVARARRRLTWRFVAHLVAVSPDLARATLRRDPPMRARAKQRLGLAAPDVAELLDPAWLAERASERPAAAALGVRVVMPVHDGFEVLQAALGRLVAHTDMPLHLVLVEDASRDPRVRPWLRDWAAAAEGRDGVTVTLLEHAENMGFIASVNRGFAALGFGEEDAARAHAPGQGAREAPVVLLNADALVPAGWAQRLIAPLGAGRDVASVTPMSNDAEIFSAPAICAPTALAPGQAEAMDAAARMLVPPATPVAAPTGVGFCMAIAPHWLARAPRFDTAFGRGYGEEVDWCRKLARQGARHVAAPDLFVEHRGATSFGEAEKRRLVTRNNAEIARRYPGYDAEVQRFILNDPLTTARVRLALAFLDSHPDLAEVPVFIAHSLGGGAEHALQARISAQAPVGAVVIRLGGLHRYRLEIVTEAGVTAAATEDAALLQRLVAQVTKRRIVYSCAVGAQEPEHVPDLLCALAEGASLDIKFHDFFPVSPSYNLLDADGVYRGPPTAAGTTDPAHVCRDRAGAAVPLAAWQASWGRAVDRAERLVVFSESSREIVAAVYPQAARRIVVAPHELPVDVPRMQPGPSGGDKGALVIGVLGNIGPPKGARLLQRLSAELRAVPDAGLVLLGQIDPAFPLDRGAIVHGPYDRRDIPYLVGKYGIDLWLVPAVWPETFSFATHECAATGLPMIAFDLGAQAEVVGALPNGLLLPLPDGPVATPETARRILAEARSLVQEARVARDLPARRVSIAGE
jgi:GT2 family glycosyltransferase